ncbi:MAG: ABC transporter permease [Ruminococcus sp.]|nr:ABC transporter permease [Ruminococcus sp.]
MKNALLKDTFREIKNSLGRFLSIFAIVALGCGFFAGLKATMPDMVETAAEYFEENKLMDLKLVSTIGIKSSDVEAVKKADHVKGAHAAYSKDVFYSYNEQNIVLKCLSFNSSLKEDSPNKLNTLTVIEGRLPQKDGECAVEVKSSSPSSFKLGERLDFTEPDDSRELTETLAHESFEIVGIVSSPLYIGYERDATTVGNGTVVSNVFLREEEFVCDYYTELYADLDIPETEDQFSEEYRELCDSYSQQAVQVFRDSVGVRFDELMKRAESRIESSQSKIDTVGGYLLLGSQELETELEKYRKMNRKAKKELEDAESSGSPTMIPKAAVVKTQEVVDILQELLEDGADAMGPAHTKYAMEVEEAREEIEEAREQLKLQNEPSVYSFNRFTASNDYSSFEGDSRKIDRISRVFPVFFILVAALVCMTTMSRMIEEQRGQIGIYKALGYSSGDIALRYLIYSLCAAVTGGVIGTCLGLKLFPAMIYRGYKILYNIPEINTPLRGTYIFWCSAAAALCIGATVLLTCLSELRAVPGRLMRPRPPKSGKRVWLEDHEKIWGRLSFLSKVTVRNLVRYKRRFAVTVAGVMGCTALIITGFGLKNSIKSIVSKQFNEVFSYDGLVVLNRNYDHDWLDSKLNSTHEIGVSMQGQLTDTEAENDGKKQKINIAVPDRPEKLYHFVTLKTIGGEDISLTDGGAVVSYKLAQLLDLEEGSTVRIKNGDEGYAELRVDGVCVNYAMHYVFMTPDTYRENFGGEPKYNVAFVNLLENTDHSRFKNELTACREFYGVTFRDEQASGFLDSVESLNSVVVLLIISAGLLAAVVLYNLANINITERMREIATVKVLGFYDMETSDYILRENFLSAFVGIALGLLAGKVLHRFVVMTAEVDVVLFDHELVPWAYGLGALITFIFTLLINVLLHFKLKKVDMVESLKSVE